MEANLLIALQITAAGMGLVFGAILLLWVVMAVLVRLTSERLVSPGVSKNSTAEHNRKRKAAAAVVAIALVLEANWSRMNSPCRQLRSYPPGRVSCAAICSQNEDVSDDCSRKD